MTRPMNSHSTPASCPQSTHSPRSHWLSLLSLLFAIHALDVPAQADELPNVLFILTEDQGAHLSLLAALRTWAEETDDSAIRWERE